MKNNSKEQKSKSKTTSNDIQIAADDNSIRINTEDNDLKSNDNAISNTNNQTIEKEDASESKGFAEEIKGLSEVLKAVAYIGSGLVLIMTTVKVYSYHSYYGIPVINLSNLSVLNSVLIHAIIVGLVLFLLFSAHYFINEKDIGNPIFDFGDRILKPLYIIASAILIFWGSSLYIFTFNAISEQLSKRHLLFITYIIIQLVIQIYCGFSIALYFLIHRRVKRKRGKSTKRIYDIVVFFKLIIRKIRRLKSFKKILKDPIEEATKISRAAYIFSAVIVFLAFLLTALFRVIYSEWIPNEDSKYEITQKDNQSYVTVCNSNNGKLVVKCDEFIENDIVCLNIYRNNFQYFDPKDYTFTYKSFDYVSNDGVWHQPVGTNKGTDNVSIVLSDKARGNGNYDLRTSFCHYLYLEIINNEDKEVSLGETYMLEIYEYGQWRSLPFKKSVDLVNSACVVEPKGTKLAFFDFLAYGDLGPGKYRIALSSDENGTSFYYVEFTVNEEGTIKLT